MNLSAYTQGKNNNFNAIRMLAALAVLVTHSFALAVGTGDAEPFTASLDMNLGTVAVDVFFITSGFLVTNSLLTRQSALEFVWARCLRIFPALLVMLVLTVFGAGLIFTRLPALAYLSDKAVYVYFLKCATLIFGIDWSLPEVFDNNPYKSAFNGSLWSMPYELRMYASLLLLWLVLRMVRGVRIKVFGAAIVVSAVASALAFVGLHFTSAVQYQGVKLFFMFFTGAAFFVLRDRIVLMPAVFFGGLLALVLAAGLDKQLFFLAYTLGIAYLLFYLAYVPAGAVRHYNRVGDYSYGMYIYAFPVQQAIAASIPGVSVAAMIGLSAVVTLALAVLSWHLLEKRALGLKGLYVGHTRKWLGFGQPG